MSTTIPRTTLAGSRAPSAAEAVALLLSATPATVGPLLFALGDDRGRSALADVCDRSDLAPGEVLRLLRAASRSHRHLVEDIADGGGRLASRVRAEMRVLEGASLDGWRAELLSGHEDVDPRLGPAVLRSMTDDAGAMRRLLGRMELDTVGYADARALASNISRARADRPSDLGLPRLRVALMGDVTTSYLAALLPSALLFRGVDASVMEAPFGQQHEVVLDPGSVVARWRPDVVVALTSSLALRGEDASASVEARVSLAAAVSERLGADAILTTWEPTPDHASPTGQSAMLAERDHLLRASLPPRAHLFDLTALVNEVGMERWFDLRLWAFARQSFDLERAPLFADRLARYIRAWLEPPIKLIVTDLDGTLWGGVAAEVDPRELDIDPDRRGMGHLGLQRYLKERVREGYVLAALSKSTLSAARAPFPAHPEMPLALEDFALFHASFAPKSLVLPRIVEELNLGLAQTMFLDDSPHERAEVRERLPEVTVPEWPTQGVVALPAALARSGLLLRVRSTGEDAGRADMYRHERLRASAREEFADVGEFLANLRLTARFTPLPSADVDRATQLIQKTNQFNLTTERWTRRELEERARRERAYAYTVSVEDRYGPYGSTALLVATPAPGDRLIVEQWLMSCRVMGKTVEVAIFEHLLAFARASGFREIEGVYRPTSRNMEVAGLYASLGFWPLAESPSEARYVFHVSDQPAVPNRYVAVEGEAGR